MLRHEHRTACSLGMRHERRHIRDRGQIEVARRLVQEQVGGMQRPDARERYLLTLTA